MSNGSESAGGLQPAPRPDSEDVPSYERPPEPTPETPPEPRPEPKPAPPAYGPPEPSLESISRTVDDLHAAAFAEAAEPTEADLREVAQVEEPIAVEEPAARTPRGDRTDAAHGRAGHASPDRAPAAPEPSAAGELLPLTPEQERLFAALGHVSGLFLPFLGPVLVLLLNQRRSSWLRSQALEALNFQLNLLFWAIVSAVGTVILIGLCGLFAVGIAGLVLPIVAAVQSLSGGSFRYPWIVRLFR